MSKGLLFLAITFLLIVLQLLFPKYLLFIPILIVLVLLISPKWGLGWMFVFGLWLDSLYDHPLVIPYTILLVLLGVTVEWLRGRFSKKLKALGMYLVAISTVIFCFIHTSWTVFSWYYVGRLLLIFVVNMVIYYVLYSLWHKLNRWYV